MSAISLQSVSKFYGKHEALKSLNLNIATGEIFCLLGQNGAGKTTTINLLLGFIEPDQGQVLVHGASVSANANTVKQKIAYIPEVVQLYGNLTGVENLDFFSRLAGASYSKEELRTFLRKAGLQEDAYTKRLQHYSKGMRQKVGIAIALAKNADVILMDEPTSGLDPKATAEFTNIVKDLGNQGKTIFMATHDIFNAVNLGTRIGIMKEGRMVHDFMANDFDASALQQIYLETI
jgi:ABC-2 type transport system ATP-binding protein